MFALRNSRKKKKKKICLGMNGRILNLNICSSFDLTTFLPYVFIPSTQESFLGLFTAFWLVFSSPLFEIVLAVKLKSDPHPTPDNQ